MATDLKNQNFGVEIELTGITRETAIGIIADYYGTSSRHSGGTYDAYSAADRKNRIWKAVSDASINATHSVRGTQVPAPRDYKCEVVTPVLQYEDIEDLQNIVRLLRSKGAVANASTGIHIHVDGKDHTPGSISRLLGFAAGRQDLFYEALGITDRGTHWCTESNLGILLTMYSGLRIGELCALTWNDIDFKNGVVRVSKALQRVPDKSGKGRTALIVTSPKSKTSVRDIPIPAFVLDILKQNERSGYILSGNNKPVEPRTMQNRFKAVLKECDIPLWR